MLDYIKKIYTRIGLRKGRRIKYTRKQKEEYLRKFREPRDDIERSYFQYCCQKWIEGNRVINIIASIASMVLYLPYYCYYRLRSNSRKSIMQECEYIVTTESILQSIPDEYASRCIIPDFYRGVLTKWDSGFLKLISRRYPFAFYFRFKIMCRIANYSYIIQNYSPSIIFCSAEYSYTSSVLTMYCEKRGVELDNVMHGEKIFNISDSFSRFTKFFVWDEFYIDLFMLLRASKTEYIVNPIKVQPMQIEFQEKHYTYYLQAQTLEQLKAIKDKFDSMNVDYLVRPHPVYSTNDVWKVFDENQIESNQINIWDSIQHAGHVVSVDSTVNYQAYLVGVEVVLDDISDPEYYAKLKENGYIMLQKPHLLLSELK